MPQSETPSPIGNFWSHQAFVLAGLSKLSRARLRGEWSTALTGAKLLNHMQQLSAAITHLATLAEDLPIGQIQFSFDVIGGMLGDADKVIQSALNHLGIVFNPVVPNPYIAGGLNDSFGILQGVRLLEDQHRIPGLGPVRWIDFHGRKWNREILESNGSAR